MSLIVKIIISVVVAAVAAAATNWFTVQDQGLLVLFIAFCAATITTTLLTSIPGSGPESAAGDNEKQARRRSSPASARPARAPASDADREEGQVKWFNVSKGFGFITKDDGEEIFVHFRSIRGGGRRSLRDGQRVSFVVAQSDKGPQAEDVESLD